MKFDPSPTASKRTKNRLREHPAGFIVLEERNVSTPAFGGPAFLVRCLCSPGDNNHSWVGWLPKDGVIVSSDTVRA